MKNQCFRKLSTFAKNKADANSNLTLTPANLGDVIVIVFNNYELESAQKETGPFPLTDDPAFDV